MKKILLKLIVATAAAPLLVACGGGSSNSTPPTTTSSANSVASSAAVSSSVASSSVVASSSTSSASSASSSIASFEGLVYQAEDNFFSGGVTNAGTYLQNFATVGARVVFTVNANVAGTHGIKLNYANANSGDKTLKIYVNGLVSTTTTLAATGGATTWATKVEQVNLRAGVNTITYQYDTGTTGGVNIDSIELENGVALATRGATLPYQEFEAEDGATNGQVSAANRTYLTVESESSGRKFVALNATGNYVEWVATKAANSLVVRYNLPDAANGGGTTGTLSLYINGVKAKSLDLTSRFAWVYGDYPYNDNPANTKGHHFYDESHFSGLDIPAGATVRLQKDAADTAAYYNIDLVDLEQIESAYTMPANFVDITTYGAIANDNIDDQSAIVAAITAAKAANKGVWIPAGTFILSGRPDVANVHIRGAGMWYSTLHGINGKGGFRAQGNNITIADLFLDSDSIVRKDAEDNPGFEGNFGTGSLIQNVWVEHMKVGLWVVDGNGLFVVNGRVRDTWADGVNFAGGMKNSTLSQFNFRNTGDDNLAMWSNGTANENNTFRYNYAQLPVLANTFALYGGKDNKVLDNIAADTVVSASGIQISTRFGATSFAGTTEAKRNTLNRTGGFDPGWNTTFGGLWVYAEGQAISSPVVIDNVDINDSTYDGFLLSYNQNITNLSVTNVNINGAGAYGINVAVNGSATFSNVKVKDTVLSALNNTWQFVITRGDGNTGW